jgi:Uma2 family endonuclease
MALPKTRISPEEYLALERASDTKHEYYRGEIFAMAGASPNHTIISMNIGASLHAQLRKKPCTVHLADLRVKISSTGLYTYPDVVVVCGEPKYDDRQKDTLLNPTVIVEVLSPTTEAYDRGSKFEMYRTIESLQEYVLVNQDKMHIDHYRLTEKGWLLDDASSPDATINLPSINCRLLLADVYEKVRFEDPSTGALPLASGDA